MNMKNNLAILGLLGASCLAGPATAAEETANLGVTAVVADTCILAAGTALSFATINTAQTTNQAVPGIVTVTCTSTRPNVTVTLDGGDNASGGSRRMKSADNNFLPYQVFSDAGHGSAVGVGGTLYNAGVTAATPQVLSVYGQIPAGSYSAGAYTDTILVTLSY